MTTLLSVLLACACGAAAKQPAAKKKAPLPEAPSVSKAAADEASQKALHDAVFIPKSALADSASAPSYRLPKIDDKYETVGHKDVTTEAMTQSRSYDLFPEETGPYSRTKTESVELSFLSPAPGMTLGVGYSERKAWMGADRMKTHTAEFAVLRVTLGPAERKPTLFMPEARVSKRRDFQGEKVDRYSIEDLPPGLRP